MMNYNNLVIFKNDSIIWKNSDKELLISFHKNVYSEGIIINEDLFIKKYLKSLKQAKISTFFFNKSVIVIYDSNISINDVLIIKNTFINLNYKKVILKSDLSFIKINRKDNYLLVDDKYKLYYLDKYNNKKVLTLSKKLSNNELNIIISNRSFNKNLFIIGKIDKSFLHNNINYYLYESVLQFFLQFIFLEK